MRTARALSNFSNRRLSLKLEEAQGMMKHIHMIGIGGSAMSPLAGMLRERGYRVTGSDAGVYPPASILLETLGIQDDFQVDPPHLSPAPDPLVAANGNYRRNV